LGSAVRTLTDAYSEIQPEQIFVADWTMENGRAKIVLLFFKDLYLMAY
jgi:hypothetical protein